LSRDLPIFVLNLDDSPGRLAAVTGHLSEHGLEAIRVAGIDGRLPGVLDRPDVDDAASRRHMGRSLTPGEVGCYLGHLGALRAFLAHGAEVGVVLEDDAVLDPRFGQGVAAAAGWVMARPEAWAINLGPSRLKYATLAADLPAVALHHAFYFPMLATGMMWTRAGAARMLEDCARVTMPWDNRMRDWLTGGPHGYAAWPVLVRPAEGSSDIERANAGGRRGGHKRAPLYFLRKQRRLAIEKVRAALARRRHLRGGR
jgi:glycosyl transferase family 25